MRIALRKTREAAIHAALFLCATLSVLTTAGIIWVLASESVRFFGEGPLTDYLFGTRWSPPLEPRSFGVLPLLCGTFLVAAGALLIAVPVGLATAVFLSEYAPPRFRQVHKPVLE